EQDEELCIVKDALRRGLFIRPTSPSLAEYAKISHELRLVNNHVYWAGNPRKLLLVIPTACLEELINKAHAIGHTNTQATVETLRKICYLLWMWRRTYEVVAKCPGCVRNQVPDPVLPMQQVSRATAPWQVLHIDIVSYGPIHFLTIIDAFSKFLVWEKSSLYDVVLGGFDVDAVLY
ncbi:hypothetical protein Pmar_PMAR026468, partial [Perkinsus marinus ATCC 50983]